jgi:hypothetical protein
MLANQIPVIRVDSLSCYNGCGVDGIAQSLFGLLASSVDPEWATYGALFVQRCNRLFGQSLPRSHGSGVAFYTELRACVGTEFDFLGRRELLTWREVWKYISRRSTNRYWSTEARGYIDRKNIGEGLEDVTAGLWLVSAILDDLFANINVSPTFALSMHKIRRNDWIVPGT